jgi:hypothetical protein
MVYSRQMQATHCREAPSWTGRWFSPKGDRWWRVWACPDHLEGLTGYVTSGAGVQTDHFALCQLGGVPDRIRHFGAGSTLPRHAQTRRPIFLTMAPAGASFEDGPLHIDFDHRAVRLNAQPVELASQEYNLLAGLVRKPGAVLSYQRIVELDHRMGWRLVAAKHAGVRLRRKLGLDDDELWDGVIQHVPGIGYRYRTGRFPRCP